MPRGSLIDGSRDMRMAWLAQGRATLLPGREKELVCPSSRRLPAPIGRPLGVESRHLGCLVDANSISHERQKEMN